MFSDTPLESKLCCPLFMMDSVIHNRLAGIKDMDMFCIIDALALDRSISFQKKSSGELSCALDRCDVETLVIFRC